jgi:hypothetical protein
MSRLMLFFAISFFISFLCVSLIKISIVYMAEIFYGGRYEWSYEDVRFVLIRGSMMAFVFCLFGVIRYIKMR